ncbi:MAG: glycosyltransferase [Nitrospinota bacterium]
MHAPSEPRGSPSFPRLSVVLPVFRAEGFIRRSLDDLLAWLTRTGVSFELILVDDRSPDGTAAAIQQLQSQRPGAIRLLQNERNVGKGASVRKGMLAAEGQFRITMDCDLPYGLDTVGQMLRMLESGADVVIASRVHPESSYVINPRMFSKLVTRHWVSRLGNRIIRIVVPEVYDTQAGLKGFSREAAIHIFSRQRLNRFSYDPEVLRIAQVAGFRIVEIPVVFRYESELTTVEFASDSFRMIRDLIRIKIWEKTGKWDRPGSS